MTTMILVHGRSQQGRDPATLEYERESALLAGLFATGTNPLPSRDRLLFPYYGALYENYSLATRSPVTPAEKAKWVEFQGEMYGQMKGSLPASRKPRASTRARSAHRAPSGGAALAWYDPAFEFFDRIPGFAPGFLRLWMRDVYDYLRDHNGLRKQTMELVAKPIAAARGDRLVIVAHSLGSIVAYDILNTNPTLLVDHWITIGSPLGINKTVRDRLLPDLSGKRECPGGVKRWSNFADNNDIVALEKKLAPEFLRNGQRVIDDYLVKNTRKDPHSSQAYLRQPQLSRLLQAELT